MFVFTGPWGVLYIEITMGLLDDRKEEFLCNRLQVEWRKALSLGDFVRVRVGAKTMESVVEFHALAERLKHPTKKLVELACGRYSPDWCKETFKTNYPPFALVIGKASRKWLARELGSPVRYNATASDLERQAKEVVDSMLAAMKMDQALVLVDGGWPEDPALHAAVVAELRKGRTK